MDIARLVSGADIDLPDRIRAAYRRRLLDLLSAARATADEIDTAMRHRDRLATRAEESSLASRRRLLAGEVVQLSAVIQPGNPADQAARKARLEQELAAAEAKAMASQQARREAIDIAGYAFGREIAELEGLVAALDAEQLPPPPPPPEPARNKRASRVAA